MSKEVISEGRRETPPGFIKIDWTRGFGLQIGPLFRKDEAGRRIMGLYVEDYHTNGMRNAHGGMLMTLADMAWGNAVSMEHSVFWVTVRLTCDFLSAAKAGEWIEAGGELMSGDDDIYIVQGRVWSGERQLLSGTGVFKAVKPRDPRPGEKAFIAEAAGA